MQKTKLVVFFFVILLSSSMFISSVSGQVVTPLPTVTPSNGVTTWTEIPTAPPSNSGNQLNKSTITNSGVSVGTNNVESINPKGASLSFSPYNQTTVTLSFASCITSSLNVSSNLGNDWTESRASGYIIFYATGIDSYELHYEVLYNQIVNQTITLAIQSGDGSVTNMPLSITNTGFTLDVNLNTKILPHIATAAEQAEANARQNQQLLTQDHNYILGQNAWMKDAIIALAIGVIVAFLVIFLILRDRRHRDLEINNLNNSNWGRGKA
jgi:hypothetical protein